MFSSMTRPSWGSSNDGVLPIGNKMTEVLSGSFAYLAAASALVKMAATLKRIKKVTTRPHTPEDKKKADRAKAFFVKLYGSRQMYGQSVLDTEKPKRVDGRSVSKILLVATTVP
ncbi:hypothetical protein BJ741DRAFT_662007 [Chytriomyces cf. hyalinus JEL632]|nr:hypothetical protein BJ741DRAFT_662007 [Chytriomyces cf. hyalinus JEL632]